MLGEIVISEFVVVPFPPEELKTLRRLIKRNGMLEVILGNTGIVKNTVKRMVIEKNGRKGKVDKLVEFIRAFEKQYA